MNSSPDIRLAVTDEDIARCHPVMRQLRPHHDDTTAFVARVKFQQTGGYHLALLENESAVRAVAGFRFTESLSWGRFMYVDDLVSDGPVRGKGFGSRLMDWLIDHARARGCGQLHLDSGVEKFWAHRFYLVKGMDLTCHHFGMKI